MQLGKLQQRANTYIVYFVFACSIVVTFLLHTMQVIEAKSNSFDSISVYNSRKN